MLKSYFKPNTIEAGCDEAGRGCFAGPVFAAAVILPVRFKHPLLNDSKKLSEKQRKMLRPIIEENAISWAVTKVSNTKIDTINILNASFLAMHKSIEKLKIKPELLLIDGNQFKPYKGIPHQCIIKGDGQYLNIAAASILAKTYRDDFMEELHSYYPQYNWATNKGYGTQQHRDAILKNGTTCHHRMSFKLFPTQLKLEL